MWAFATPGQLDALLFTALASAAEWRICESNAQDVANKAWAFATAGQLDASPFAVLARAAEWRLCEFNAQALANTAWALATAGEPAPALLDPIAVLDTMGGAFKFCVKQSQKSVNAPVA